jgi:hypothetical protein
MLSRIYEAFFSRSVLFSSSSLSLSRSTEKINIKIFLFFYCVRKRKSLLAKKDFKTMIEENETGVCKKTWKKFFF